MWKKEIYTMNDDCCIFYKDYKGEQHQMQPTFANEYWEVYALHLWDGISYAVVGLHGGKRAYYEISPQLCTVPLYFVPVARDLAWRQAKAGTGAWNLVTVRNSKLTDVIAGLGNALGMHSLAVTYLKYKRGVLHLVFSAPRYFHKDRYYRQTEDGYVLLKPENAKLIMSGKVEI